MQILACLLSLIVLARFFQQGIGADAIHQSFPDYFDSNANSLNLNAHHIIIMKEIAPATVRHCFQHVLGDKPWLIGTNMETLTR